MMAPRSNMVSVGAVLASVLVAGCNARDPSPHDAGTSRDGSAHPPGVRPSLPMDAAVSSGTDAAPPESSQTPVERGEYLVRHLSGCVECHSPRLPSGQFDESRLLSGVVNLDDLDPGDPQRGAIHARTSPRTRGPGWARGATPRSRTRSSTGWHAMGACCTGRCRTSSTTR